MHPVAALHDTSNMHMNTKARLVAYQVETRYTRNNKTSDQLLEENITYLRDLRQHITSRIITRSSLITRGIDRYEQFFTKSLIQESNKKDLNQLKFIKLEEQYLLDNARYSAFSRDAEVNRVLMQTRAAAYKDKFSANRYKTFQNINYPEADFMGYNVNFRKVLKPLHIEIPSKQPVFYTATEIDDKSVYSLGFTDTETYFGTSDIQSVFKPHTPRNSGYQGLLMHSTPKSRNSEFRF